MKKILFGLLLTLALVFGLTSCDGTKDNGVYTMHDFLSSTTSLKWNPLTWETSDDSAVLGYLSLGFYDYRVAVDKKGNSLGKYEVVCEMAAELPEDVTASYVGSYGVKEGEKNKAFRIKLNKDAKWNDGTPINADDYIYSMQQQLDPAQLNRRADSFYGGDFSFVNAQNYLYSGKESYVAISKTLEEYAAEGTTVYFDAWDAWGTKGYTDAEGNTCPQYLSQDDTTVYNSAAQDDPISGAELYQLFTTVYASYAPSYSYVKKTFDVTTWDQVGLKKIDEYTIDIIIEGELENPNFYLPYHLSSTWLVKKDLYEACWTTAADGTRVNTYGTSVETTASYGPYMLTSFEADKQLKFGKNENWYGWTDKAHVVNGKRLYQTTNIQIDVISGHESQLLAFKKGQIDAVGLQAADLEEFGNSEYKMLTPQSYTTKLTFNTDKAKLAARETAGINKTMLTNQKFRKAISLSFDRSEFCTQFTAGHTAGFGLFNYMYQFFGSDGLSSSYRDSDAAKDALCRVYGIEYGKDKEFKTLDEAYKAITGYDVANAREVLKEAITEAKADGTWNGTDTVSLEFAVYQADEVYTNMFNFFNNAVKELAKGTELEGKIELTMKVDDDYYNTMYAGNTDIIFSTWGGATYGTFGMMSNVYVDDYTGDGNQMEIGFDASKVMVSFKLNDTIGEKTYSLKAWADWLNAKDNETSEDVTAIGKAADIAPETRAELLAELEYQYLNQFVNTPVYYRQTVSLRSMKIEYPTDEYIDLVGFGGISQIRYNYDDTEWDAYVASQGGELKY
jgi:oligopeptide transport system substrate-binding protein